MLRRHMLIGLLALGACSETKPGAEADLSMTTDPDLRAAADLRSAADLATAGDLLGGYPAGPYGFTVGDTVANLSWEGYVNPSATDLASTKPYVAYAMNDLRLTGKRYALIYAADTF